MYQHTLVELSAKQWIRYQSNSILVEDIVLDKTNKRNPLVSYQKITYGGNIITRRKKFISDGKMLHYKEPTIGNIKGNFLFITAKKEDILCLSKETLIVDGSTQNIGDNLFENGTSYCPSGIVVLMFCKLQNIRNKTGYTWGSHQANFCHATKDNLIDANSSHFGSKGKYYSFGNRGNYDMVDDSTVTLYVSKKYKNELRSKLAVMNADVLEEMAGAELQSAVNDMKKVLPNVTNFIAPTLNTAFQIQNVIGNYNMNKVSISECGLWQSSICINAETTQLHTENDCTYTVITVPKQDIIKESTDEYTFLFDLKKGETVGVKMVYGISFMFSGKYLTHRQAHNESTANKNSVFVNLASYGNSKLYNHIKKTIERKVNSI